jgi:ankyrin repeat protein
MSINTIRMRSSDTTKMHFDLTPLQFAIAECNLPLFKFLLKQPDFDLQVQLPLPLTDSTQRELNEGLEQLRSQSRTDTHSLGERSSNPLTALLSLAVKQHNMKAIELLLEHPGIDVQDEYGRNAFQVAHQVASQEDHSDIIELLRPYYSPEDSTPNGEAADKSKTARRQGTVDPDLTRRLSQTANMYLDQAGLIASTTSSDILPRTHPVQSSRLQAPAITKFNKTA